jgi:hypothetical protein
MGFGLNLAVSIPTAGNTIHSALAEFRFCFFSVPLSDRRPRKGAFFSLPVKQISLPTQFARWNRFPGPSQAQHNPSRKEEPHPEDFWIQ